MNNQFILMYHSIDSPNQPAVTGSFPISMQQFTQHIMKLRDKGYEFDFISNLHQKKDKKKKYIYITGDDGTIDWTRNVLPWCEDQKIPTHTGIITGPFEEKPLYPLAHIIQVILKTRKKSELENLSQRLKKSLTLAQLSYINKIYAYETIEYRKIIKGAFNLILEQHESYSILGELKPNELSLIKQRFEKLEYYKKFHFAEIGVHTKSHWALGKDVLSYINNEISPSYNLLLKNNLTPTKYFVSPMKPRYGASLKDLEEELLYLGYKGILDSNHGIWDQQDFIIPRIDAKNVEEFFQL